MSYLDTLRFHFAGRFFSNPSTVNNDPGHYDNFNFDRTINWKPGFSSEADGWWNPEGANAFQFRNVRIKAAVYEDGSLASSDTDGLFRFSVESRGVNPGKMVDLDPDQQLVSMIFGLDIALIDDAGRIALEGVFEPAPFTDIWRKGPPPGGDEAACAAYQSVLNVRSWGDVTSSRFLQQLKNAAGDNILSVKFNLDGYSMNAADAAKFAQGRIVGTLGPGKATEPRHWIVGRHFGNEVHPTGPRAPSPRFVTDSGVNYFVGMHDETRRKIRLDLGNALPVAPAAGPNQDIGELFLGWRNANGTVTEFAQIPYLAPNWYERTAGIIELPQERELTAAETQSIATSPLCLVAHRQAQRPIVSEEPKAHIRADMFVARLNPGETAVFRLHASRLGRPLPNTRINIGLLIPPGQDAKADFPRAALSMPTSVTTDAAGNAEVTMLASDPGNPRFFYTDPDNRRVHVDGQVYMVTYAIEGEPQPNPSNILSILVWNNFVPDEPPTWEGSMGAVFTQYGNLYPWMTKFGPLLDLANYAQVAAARERIRAVLLLAESNQHYMPVTRDLSKSRRAAMLRWLTELGADGLPRRGVPAAPEVAVAFEPAAKKAAAGAPSERPPAAEMERGSKTIAAERRRMVLDTPDRR
jgi:hypothetical protein